MSFFIRHCKSRHEFVRSALDSSDSRIPPSSHSRRRPKKSSNSITHRTDTRYSQDQHHKSLFSTPSPNHLKLKTLNILAAIMSDSHKSHSTLSKDALYAPLAAYEQDKVSASHYLIHKKRVPENIKESSMVEFLVQVSQHVNRNRLLTTGKNNGSKALSQSDVDTRIRQRGLTLIGGGINKEWGHGKRANTNKSTIPSNRKRKRTLLVAATNNKTSFPFDPVTGHHFSLLNNLWNDYFLLLLPTITDMMWCDPTTISSLSVRLAPIMDRVELVGAHVTIVSCNSQKGVTGTSGYVAKVTANTWTIVKLATSKGTHDKVLVVPKKGSIISLRVTLSNAKEEGTAEASTAPSVLCIAVHGK